MSRYDLSVLIPARQEMFLSQTIKSIIENKRGKTEVIAVLDGEWTDPPVEQHPDVTIIYHKEPVGQRAATNEACRLSTSKYVMKLDAHCAVDEGFDVKMMAEMHDDWTMIPMLYNLHGFNWRCKKCGNEWYQGPPPRFCCQDRDGKMRNEKCKNVKAFERIMVWKPREKRHSEFWRFDTNLHFQYHHARNKHPDAVGDFVETMSAQGSCWMLTRDKYWELGISDEEFGSWGQQGVEVACKTWLSGGRLVTNKKTWYSHMFRTQPGFSFPYPMSSINQAKARQHSKDLFIENSWPKQKYPLSWIIEKFAPLANGPKDGIPDWHDPEGKTVLDYVNKRGKEFYAKQKQEETSGVVQKPTKGIVYYTDNQLNMKIAHKCRKQLLKANLPICCVSLKPMAFGKNIVMNLTRGYEAYFRQIYTGIQNSDDDIIYLCEHDWLYHPSHFDFTPPRNDTFYYNWNWWRMRYEDGHAVRYDTQLVPGIVGYRSIFLSYYAQIIEYLEKHGFTSENAHKVGFEPGTHSRVEFAKQYRVERFDSQFPIIDIRHTNNLTSSKWTPDAFRNPNNARNWQETEEIPGWGVVRGRFKELLVSL